MENIKLHAQTNNCLVICDLDGTLVDSRGALTDTVNSVRSYYNLSPLDKDTVTGYIGNGSKALIERAMHGHNINIEEAYSLMRKSYAENTPKEKDIYPGVRSGLLKLVDAGIKLAVVTNKPQEPTEYLLDHLNLSSFFQMIVGGSDAYPLKPDPAPLMAVMKKTGVLPGNSWMIGDHHTDLEAGRRADVHTCLAAYGFGSPENEPFELEVNSFSEFTDYLSQYFRI